MSVCGRIARIEARIKDIGCKRELYGQPGWSEERAGAASLRVKWLLDLIDDIRMQREKQKEVVLRINVLQKSLLSIEEAINESDSKTIFLDDKKLCPKTDFARALRERRERIKADLDNERMFLPKTPVINTIADVVVSTGQWADQEDK